MLFFYLAVGIISISVIIWVHHILFTPYDSKETPESNTYRDIKGLLIIVGLILLYIFW